MAEKAPPEANPNRLLYQADDRPPLGLTLGLGGQFAILVIGPTVFHPTIMHSAAGSTDEVIAWAVFVSLIITAAITALHAFPIRRFGGGGYLLITSTVAPAIAVGTDALRAGGAGLLATLVVASALFQLVFASRVALFRRILTPSVSGTILMLIAVNLMQIVFDRVTDVPLGHEDQGLACALITLAIIVLVSLKGRRGLRPWAAVIGMGCGAAFAAAYGLYDVGLVRDASWVSFPRPAHVALNVDFGPSFWTLLPAFLLVSMACTIRSMSVSLAIQDVSWRTPRAADFRAVQGTVAGESLANLFAGFGGGMLMSTRSQSVALVQFSRVAARRVGLAFCALFAGIAFLPKVIALVLALPGAVFSAYLMVMVALLFVAGMKMVVSDSLDHRQGLVVGLSFWAGVGCEYGLLAPELLSGFAGGLFENGLVVGGFMAIVLTVMLELTGGRRCRLEVDLDVSSLGIIREFCARVAGEYGWTKRMTEKLEAVAEETLLTLVLEEDSPRRRLRVSAHREGNAAVLEFIARPGESNIEDRITMLSDAPAGHGMERDISLRLLRHLASGIRHRQYRDIDFITMRVANTNEETSPR